MRYLILLLPILASAWTFSISDLSNYSDKQLEVLRISYLTGEQHDLALTLSALAIVESRAGKFDFNSNHICGSHQLNTNFTQASCAALESNPFVSALEARDNFLWWYNYSGKNWAKAIQHYNAGFKLVPHSKVYLSRIVLVMKQLKEHKQLFLHLIGL